MAKIKALLNYFTTGEKILWCVCIAAVSVVYFATGRQDTFNYTASLIGTSSLLLNAKGNPIGQFLTIVFSVFYGIVSYSFAYYGEMITYLGMTAPMALLALISWLRHPYKGKKSEVTVNTIKGREILLLCVLTVAVTTAFYFILKALGNANLIPGTLSVTTSFVAVYLTFRRSPYFALAYAANDVVLLVLWGLASMQNTAYISVLVCFVSFLANDIYGFANWLKMKKKQACDLADQQPV